MAYDIGLQKASTGVVKDKDTSTEVANSNGLDFSKGFTYQNTDLSRVANSEKDAEELCHERMEKYLGKKISTKKVSNEEIASYIRGLDDRQKKIMTSLANDGCGFNDAVAYMEVADEFAYPTSSGLTKFEKKGKSTSNWVTPTAIGGGLLGLNLLRYPLGAGLSSAGDAIYGLAFKPSEDMANKEIRLKGNLDNAKDELKTTKKELRTAKLSGKGIEEVTEKVKEAKKQIEDYEKRLKNLRTTAKTAEDYRIGGGLFKNWTPKSVGSDAWKKSVKLWNSQVIPLLEKSQSTFNVQEIIESMKGELKGLSKGDPEKTKAYEEAYNQLKNWYSGEEFKSKSAKEIQELKSGIQQRTAPKFYVEKGTNIQHEITNEYQQLKAMFGEKLKNDLHSKLSKEFGKDTAKAFKDWWILTDIAEREANMMANGGDAGNVANAAKSTVKNALGTKLGLGLKGLGNYFKNTSLIGLVKKIKPVKLMKGLLKSSPEGFAQIIMQNTIGGPTPEDILGGILEQVTYNNELRKRGIDPSTEQYEIDYGQNKDSIFTRYQQREKEIDDWVRSQDWYKDLEEGNPKTLMDLGYTPEQLEEILDSIE